MLPKNIFNINKIISFLSIILLLSVLLLVLMQKDAKASYDEKFKNYPGYEELIKELQAVHPNWEFEILETNLNWADVITAESIGTHGINVVPKGWDSSWKCYCQKKVDGGAWVCASSSAVAYYMDPRNSLNEDYIFQFEKLTFDENAQTAEGVAIILSDCNYMQGNIKYYDADGNQKTMNKTYIDVIMEAGKKYNVSPYHLASKIRQEQGTGNGSKMITGTYPGYKGLYNYFNVKAFGNTEAGVIEKGLMHAKEQGWTDPEKSIYGGAALIVNEYMSCGQDTLYLEKFDVVPDAGLYCWQYMTNVSGSRSEGEGIRKAYKEMGLINETTKIKFKIPVYNNMPEQRASIPGMEQIVTQDVQITLDDVIVRKGKGTNYPVITTLNKGTKILRIELDKNKDENGRYWDKVVLKDGTKGYISREFLEQISIQSNTNEKYIVTAWTNFRNGPGTEGGTTVIEQLPPGQIITVVEKGKYPSVDGEAWYRVKLADGTYGYVGTGFMEPYTESKPKVPGSSSEQNPSDENNDNIGDGVDGQGQEKPPTTQEIGYKMVENNLICKPEMAVEELKEKLSGVTIQDADKNEKTEGNLATGWTVTYNENSYTVVVLGDTTGNGIMDAADLLAIQRHLLGKVELKEAFLLAADTTKNGNIDAADLLAIQRHLLGKTKIGI